MTEITKQILKTIQIEFSVVLFFPCSSNTVIHCTAMDFLSPIHFLTLEENKKEINKDEQVNEFGSIRHATATRVGGKKEHAQSRNESPHFQKT